MKGLVMPAGFGENSTKVELPSKVFKHYECITREGVLDGLHLELGGQVFETQEAIPWNFTISNTGNGLLVHGHLRFDSSTQCARCLEEALVKVDVDVNGYYVLKDKMAEEAEHDVKLVPKDHVIDLMDDIEAAVFMELPFRTLCFEDCKGLCAICGTNLNKGACDCKADEPEFGENKPFRALKDYTFA
ncbi:MAG: DUF177 domain-containing protein [Eggerthellaceae bacterium]|nr:DUF177 domain-containing protein [Eggerthellaceae bacterium]